MADDAPSTENEVDLDADLALSDVSSLEPQAKAAAAPPPPTELPPPTGLPGLFFKLQGKLKARREARKKAKGSSGKDGVWAAKQAEKGRQLLTEFKNLFGAFVSPDPLTRRMAHFLVLCLMGIVIIGFYASRRIAFFRHFGKNMTIGSDEQAKNLGEFFAKQSSLNAARLVTVAMGSFVVELKEPANYKKIPGYMNMAELDIVLDCDVRTTANFIQEHMPQARDQMTNVFIATEKDQFLSSEGKKRLRRALLEKLNAWLPKGKVKELYFNKLLIS